MTSKLRIDEIVDSTDTGSPAFPLGVAVNGNIAITGVGRRITGDFDNTTVDNKVFVQTNTPNQVTTFSVAPSGTGQTSYFDAWNVSSGFTNTSYGRFGHGGASVVIESTVIGTGTYLPISFYTSNAEAGRFDTSRNFLVGTTSANGKITSNSSFNTVDGQWSSNVALAVKGSFGGGISLVDGTAGYTMYCSNNGNDFYIQGATSLAGGLTGGVFLNDRGTSWSSASDERMKTIIEPITNAVAKVSQLRAVIGRYNYEEEHKRHPFLIAQDLKKVLPEAVSIANKADPVEDQMLAVSYTDTVPLLVAAIKELSDKVDTLQAELNTLKGN